jgi:hypothetical protein
MPAIPRPRCYTNAANSIDWRELRAAAKLLRAQSTRHGRRGFTLRQCLANTMALARAEQEMRTDSPFSGAADAVDAALEALGLDDYGAAEREEAIAAFHAGRPCCLTTGGYSQQGALIAASAINRGDADLAWFFPASDARAALAPLAFAAALIRAGTLRPLNPAARRMFAQATALDRLAA